MGNDGVVACAPQIPRSTPATTPDFRANAAAPRAPAMKRWSQLIQRDIDNGRGFCRNVPMIVLPLPPEGAARTYLRPPENSPVLPVNPSQLLSKVRRCDLPPKPRVNAIPPCPPWRSPPSQGQRSSDFAIRWSVELENQIAYRSWPEVFHVVHFARGKINQARRFNATTHRFHRACEHNDRHVMSICMARIASVSLQFG